MPDADITLRPEPPVHAREDQIFPRLGQPLIARIAAYGAEESPASDTLLFGRGDRGPDFFVVLAGAIDLFDADGGYVRSYLPGQFSGELHLFSGRASLLDGRAAKGTRLLRLAPDAFRRMASAEPDIGEMVMRAFILRRVDLLATGSGGITLVGSAEDPETHRIREFLTRNAHPHRFVDLRDPAAPEALTAEELPAVLMPEGRVLSRPSSAQLADLLGLNAMPEGGATYDLVVVGAGPAGLAAAVYGASEGLSTFVVEAEAPGGQAGTSSRIENYLGFPTGISGQALAGRAITQAHKFGAVLRVSARAEHLDCSSRPFRIALAGGETVQARAVVIATGARYRRLDLPGYAALEGCGVYYAATPMEAQLCAGAEVVVVGGGNSAGQAAMFLSRSCAKVHILVRGPGLAATMSDYLVQRIANSANVQLHPFCEVTSVEGSEFLTRLRWRDRANDTTETRDVRGLFVMIGAAPNTEWVSDCLTLDPAGFVPTGLDAEGRPLASPYATTIDGVFAVGDVRAGSVKRVASGVGEGAAVVSAVHRHLAG
ncbi:FAD-dependent oxidoreductase [Sphingomonas sp. TDK1]|uniref:FAD-dependent oxidoreductase n=1 Tax=Sphingomonas sp. TDK1 TaxID=453247 RepID=UPI0007D9FF3E|nr:FAD-dependent oxidoreductase [Sphingomonas sp. TDK1]OAN66565.1 cation tolerance protein CutA [Sphingomonas sp. TDK1]